MTDYTELKRLADELIAANDLFNESPQDNEVGDVWSLANDRFTEAASPEAILALIAENERLRADCSSMRGSLKAYSATTKKLVKDGSRAARERDQVRAEVAGLRTGYEAYERVNAELKAENERLNDEYDKAWRHDLNDNKNVQVLAAEVACLSAENKALRNALAECTNSLQGEMLQKFGGQLPEDMHPVTRREYDRDIAEVSGYRAALGQGEQS
jgi:regulator of replication initiation timing